MPKLNQIVAIEKGVKSRTTRTITDIHQACQKPALFNGMERTYRSKDDDGDQFPAEQTRVQQVAATLVKQAIKEWRDIFDVVATKDVGNTHAAADVRVNGTTLLTGMPVTFLLFLEKQLVDIRTFIQKLPTLDPAKEWHKDENFSLFRTDKRESIKTKKVPRAMVLHEGDKDHPAQTAMVSEDVIIGHWEHTDLSSAITETRQATLLDRVEDLITSVKMAREAANNTEVEHQQAGAAVLDWLFAD